MFSIIGILLVFGAVIGGFLMEKGNLAVLVQPAELVTIGGAALGTMLAANPTHILKGIAGGLVGVVGGSKFPQQRYLDTLKMMFDLFTKARKDGMVSIEGDIEEADKSELFKKYPVFLKDHHARAFVCDTLRMALTGGVSTFDVDQVMQHLDDIGSIGRGIAIAFVATLYGVGLANLVLLPLAGKLRAHAREMHLLRERTLEGVASMVEGASPRALREKLGVATAERAPSPIAQVKAAR
ncbi:motility-associated protein [Acidipila sp. EB88]|uniref:motility-associated protein n=1 Tax=Acidipila sp. EB88 TaxID=2305226 RepID=UPI000F601537|nr:motility-associated protein [Acidipila sp. EB88]